VEVMRTWKVLAIVDSVPSRPEINNTLILCFEALALLHGVIKIASVIADIRRLLAERPFVPFSVYCTDGGVVRIPTVDHAVISPTGRRVVVFFDDDTAQYLSPLHISRVAVDESPAG
jgi:hypothetical protein